MMDDPSSLFELRRGTQRSEDRRQGTEVRGQKTEDRSQRTDVRGQPRCRPEKFTRLRRAASLIEKETLACVIVGSATVPTIFGGHGGPPYGLKHLKFHISVAAGRERPVKSKKEL